MFTHKERANVRAALTRLGLPPESVTAVARDVARLQTAAVTACNVELTALQIARRDAAEVRIMAALRPTGAKVRVEGDPRGYVVKVHHPALRPNSWGGVEAGHGLGGGL